ncbi:PilW family protein [Nitrospina sp. 32_T5]|uniref:PilW family protein n=1 Tax=unclassified Nitrospina TaxID=2638683 RepID=UPI003F976698
MSTWTQLNRNQKGFSVIELIIVMGITTVVMGAAMYTFMKQEKVIRTEQAASQIRAAGRAGINELAKELRRIGYGMPRSHGLYSVGSNYVYWWINTDDATTAVTADVTSGDVLLNVQDANLMATQTGGFGYLMLRTVKQADQWNMVRFTTAVGGNIVNLSMYPNQDFSVSTDTVQVSKMRYQRITHNATTNIVQFFDDGDPVVPLVHNVKSVAFTYSNSAGSTVTVPLSNTGWTSSVGNTTGSNNIHTIRKIGITLTMEDPEDFAEDIILKTDVNLRNMGS